MVLHRQGTTVSVECTDSCPDTNRLPNDPGEVIVRSFKNISTIPVYTMLLILFGRCLSYNSASSLVNGTKSVVQSIKL